MNKHFTVTPDKGQAAIPMGDFLDHLDKIHHVRNLIEAAHYAALYEAEGDARRAIDAIHFDIAEQFDAALEGFRVLRAAARDITTGGAS